jgi:hypothetical protein
MTNEREQLIHAGRRCMWRAAVGTDHLGTDLRRLEQSLLGALSEFRA